jgi:hypothetical protein
MPYSVDDIADFLLHLFFPDEPEAKTIGFHPG